MAFVPSLSGSRCLMVEMRKLLPPNKDSAPQGYNSNPLPLDSPPSPPLPPPQLQEKTPSSSLSHLFLTCFSVESAMLCCVIKSAMFLMMEGFYGPLGELRGKLCRAPLLSQFTFHNTLLQHVSVFTGNHC